LIVINADTKRVYKDLLEMHKPLTAFDSGILIWQKHYWSCFFK